MLNRPFVLVEVWIILCLSAAFSFFGCLEANLNKTGAVRPSIDHIQSRQYPCTLGIVKCLSKLGLSCSSLHEAQKE